MAKRRAQGEGSVYQRASDGLWVGAVEMPTETGRRKRKLVYGRTQAEALARRRDIQAAIAAGRPILDERARVGDFLDLWLDQVVKPGREYATWHGYEVNVRLHIKPMLGTKQLAKLNPADVVALINAKRRAGLSDRTVQYVHAVLRAALATAERWGMVSRNVATLVDPVTVHREEVQPFSQEDAERLLAAAPSSRLGAFFTVAVAVGLRPGEALGLGWEDVDLDAGTVRIRRALKKGPDGLVLGATKSNRARRTIPLPAVCVRSLKDQRRRQLEERLAAGERWEDHGLVFTTRRGRPLDHRNVARSFEDLQARAGVVRHRLYDTRHTAASLLLAQGVPARVVMEVLGHSTYALTMNTYTHVMPVLMRDAADAMDRALGS